MSGQHSIVAVTAKETAELVPFEVPASLGANEVRGRSLYTLISPGTELAWNYQGSQFPTYPGYAAVFEIEQVGSDVTQYKPGDRVFGMGNHSSFQQKAVDAIVPVPAGLDVKIAAIARLMGITMSTLVTTTARPNDWVLVTGTGPVGFLGAQLFHLSGYKVMVVEPDKARQAIIRRAGIERVYSSVSEIDPAAVGKVALNLECSGHEQAVLDACKVVRRRGEVVLVGVPWTRRTDLYAHELLHAVFHKYVVLRSGWEWELALHSSDFAAHSIYDNFTTALDWLRQGKIYLDDLIEYTDPRDAQAAYQALLKRQNQRLYIMFDWTLPR